jgi:hypothetical protein
LTNEDSTTNVVTVARYEGIISQQGDAFSATNMNDLEDRVEAEFNEINNNLANEGQWVNLTIGSGWTGDLKARHDKLHSQIFISGYVYASPTVTSDSFCDLTGATGNGLPTPIQNTVNVGIPCIKSNGTSCYIYAYLNRHLTLAGNTTKPCYVNIDFSYRY